ncbi:MAG: dihydroorotate dehydrogenase electron transfer subunit [Clostridia bacterium]|nr:dihydroorotate dehydrogenase electron transfer subunit [Clostridia bacterium]
MPTIIENSLIAPDIYRMRVKGIAQGAPGQFFMLRTSRGMDPFLPRPISICDATAEETTFVYRTVGKGTALLSAMREGDALLCGLPLGNGFPLCEGKAVLIGGGLGVAPLLYLAKRLQQTGVYTYAYVGYSGEPFLQEEYQGAAGEFHPKQGGYITDDVDFSLPATYYACGPEPMLKAAAKKARAAGAKLHVSVESRMACGTGACLGCVLPTAHGNRRVCKDGPVFDATELYFEDTL